MTVCLATVQGSGNYVPPVPFDFNVLVCVGQSLTFGPAAGLPTVTGAFGYWDTDCTPGGSGIVSAFWHALHGTGVHASHGPDRSAGAALLAANPAYSGRLAIMCIAYGATFYTDWAGPSSPGRAYGPVKTAIQAACAQLPALAGEGAQIKFRQIRNLGQDDIRVNSLPYQQGWGAAQLAWTTALQNDIVAPAMAPGTVYSWKPDLIIQTQTGIANAFFEATGVRASQASIVDANHLLNIDPNPGDPNAVVYESNGVHPVAYPALTGTVQLGTLYGNRVAFLDSIGQ